MIRVSLEPSPVTCGWMLTRNATDLESGENSRRCLPSTQKERKRRMREGEYVSRCRQVRWQVVEAGPAHDLHSDAFSRVDCVFLDVGPSFWFPWKRLRPGPRLPRRVSVWRNAQRRMNLPLLLSRPLHWWTIDFSVYLAHWTSSPPKNQRFTWQVSCFVRRVINSGDDPKSSLPARRRSRWWNDT